MNEQPEVYLMMSAYAVWRKINAALTLGVAICWWPVLADAQLRIGTNVEGQSVFFGMARKVSVTISNLGDEDFVGVIRTRLFEASSATAVLFSEKSWKTLRVLPHQTILETIPIDFPMVKARTKFILQWVENDNRVIGKTEMLVYPTNLLDELKRIAPDSGETLGLLDASDQLGTVLKQSAVKFLDLANHQLDVFSGKLAVVTPCRPGDPEWIDLSDRIGKLAQRGMPVVWIQTPSHLVPEYVSPSFYIVPKSKACVVVVSPEMVANLQDDPQSQLNLIHFCRLALKPQPAVLPELSIDH